MRSISTPNLNLQQLTNPRALILAQTNHSSAKLALLTKARWERSAAALSRRPRCWLVMLPLVMSSAPPANFRILLKWAKLTRLTELQQRPRQTAERDAINVWLSSTFSILIHLRYRSMLLLSGDLRSMLVKLRKRDRETGRKRETWREREREKGRERERGRK